ncbi:hypothetical protein [Rickettsiella endosymbiont of Dermanyssus gallinae]|uniref:hypothetical protein n=1 Tax=Rickettsiella endosymbiont of Dermanyssus gallinae TaxID=2856608 RepID=UPI001C52E140|nr:hypothetical protein [Rickettsiella endosymbiont of Dermanyssus gallinae]
MLEIKNGVIKNIDQLSPESQNYLKKRTEKLKLANPSDQFDIGFLYTYGVSANEPWEDAKEKFQSDKIKELFPSVGKKLNTKDRQKKTISEIVDLIKNDILSKIKAKEEQYLKSCESTFNRRRTLANFLKRLTIGIFGSTLVALATTALITQGYISLPILMPIIMPVVALVMANPITASGALITVMSMLFLASWKAVSSKRNAEHALEKAKTQTEGNIESLNSAKDQNITPMKGPSFSGIRPLQSDVAATVQRSAKPSSGEDTVEQAGRSTPSPVRR